MRAIEAHYVKAADWSATAEETRDQQGHEMAGGTDQAVLLAPVYTGDGAAMATILSLSHFNEHQDLAFARDQVDFTGATAQIGRQDAQPALAQVQAGPTFGGMALLLCG